ncbi:SAM-dependent methyltransferase [Janibacter limosus]|jgi:tRNA-Thr(GGU) m(6)t(6)A37 methyltransferase TsaA|uniref:S-adenosylmethionine-dependent methyltransferase n=1 Tax=Janibacter limosus TaxID=53458 RepID=A0A4P6MWQ6_9MICO|nr:SAM-dependent methyltransferase [Janibacter limosus]QBF47469.1 S-adenosylmethionine-dependent methyltransferase [Janibacter limosus]
MTAPSQDWKNPVTLSPIGVVRGGRPTGDDDYWGGFESTIELDSERFGADALAALDTYSHVLVLFHFHLLTPGSEETGGRHPRGRKDWPLVGIFAQRAKKRPNFVGATTCRVVSVDGTTLTVEGLDAMDGTPILDLKPHMQEFEPRGEVIQPEWSHNVMADYFAPHTEGPQ